LLAETWCYQASHFSLSRT